MRFISWGPFRHDLRRRGSTRDSMIPFAEVVILYKSGNETVCKWSTYATPWQCQSISRDWISSCYPWLVDSFVRVNGISFCFVNNPDCFWGLPFKKSHSERQTMEIANEIRPMSSMTSNQLIHFQPSFGGPLSEKSHNSPDHKSGWIQRLCCNLSRKSARRRVVTEREKLVYLCILISRQILPVR